ncbi:MAG: hypothetical protein B0D96_11110 [Candidatus Sedimenticola endophacoides]|uniref:SPOR domain-containing protein n=1 Tax=Candidatus Sedimenticola endophacoides TaxID=2548426 RepID=A0A6N4E764_9GAMM|nr:MAG: hypothetical protein B0D94_07280 [Candidatus Sedimenticola endophacoides]OQX33718.1 MAG: hypothetical protein B0D96_11110 [Candidatus Sedimenticola endophacoides]OQX40206.1 MAG: hypothetical protein B0D89_08620 [Candidatus Sedimenticola endophacoides]PUD98660.1 MAG: hypothetical protein C3L26_11785 [Candidatus Sedimenticola endophacoides]PUE01871.1 MAG: hypothetical protein C3L25_11690 [Candidatus Sedimenticola endophacoides]
MHSIGEDPDAEALERMAADLRARPQPDTAPPSQAPAPAEGAEESPGEQAAETPGNTEPAAGPAPKRPPPGWIASQPAQAQTLQLIATADPTALTRFLRQLHPQARLAAFSFRHRGKIWHALIHGSYANEDVAYQAALALRREGLPVEPWIRGFAGIHERMLEELQVIPAP